MEDNELSVSLDTEKKTPAPGTDERREYDAKAAQKYRDQKKSRIESKNRQPRSKTEVSKKDAREILTDRGIRNSRVIDVLIDLTETAARRNKLIFNKHLLMHGLRSTLAVIDGQEFDEPEDGEIAGELISRLELYALWDVSSASISFDEFLTLRRVCKTDCFRLGKGVLGKDFHEKPHRYWADFFPKFNPDGLKPGYSQEDMKSWLSSQSDVKEFLLLASRNAYKSSFSIVWLISAILCCPDIRALLVSETKPLSRGFIRSLRNYFEIKNTNEPTLFQQLFPEYCIPAGEGSTLTFESPMAHLGLIQSTAESTSMDSTVAGNRADIILFDDPISNITTGNEDQRQASVDKYDLMLKLREVGGYCTILGTPWHIADLYATLIARNEQNEERPLSFKINPAWTVKPEFSHKELKDLIESDVDLLFPSRLTWKFLQRELKNNPKFFRSQNLCEFVPDEETTIKINFDHDVLVQNIVALKDLPQGETVITVDVAFSQSRYADNSAISVVRLYTNPQTAEKCMAVLTVDAGRMRMSELAHKLVMLTRQYSPRTVVIEKSPTFDLIQSEIVRTGAKYSTHVPVWWCPTSNQKGAKRIRLKALEVLLAQGRLKFASGPYIDELFAELERLDGTKSSSSKKDDRADSLGLAQKLFLPAVSADQDGKDLEESRKMLAEQRQMALRNANYSRLFGGQGVAVPTVEPVPRNYFPTFTRGKAA